MKYFGIAVVFFLMQTANAQTITVGNVKVSVKADSAASAQEQALDQAHQLAFQKLINENFSESADSLPSRDALRDMVTDFSVDREKTTPTSYTASLTFQFDEPSVLTWLQRNQQMSPSLPFGHQAYEESTPINITVSYRNHAEWQHIKKTLENFPGVQALSVFTLSTKNAKIRITYRGPIDKLKQGLMQKAMLFTQQEDGWVIVSSELVLR